MEKSLGRAVALLIGVLLLGMTSCASGPDARASKFQDAELADMVIRYSTEETIFRLKPDGRDGAFLRIFDRKSICEEAAGIPGQRYMAVVLIDYIRSPQDERALIDSWVASFQPLNYQRVVFLRASRSDSINGLRVVEDRLLARYADAPAQSGLAKL